MNRSLDRAHDSLLAVRGEHRSFALPSAAVVAVERLDPRSAERPLALHELLDDGSGGAGELGNVLRLLVGAERLAVLSHGSLSLLEGATFELLALPIELRARAPLVSHVVTIAGKPSLFLLSPERLLEVDRVRRASVTALPDPR